MASTTPLQDQWEDFRRRAVHPDTGEWQVGEMRRLFFAGALGMMAATPDEASAILVDAELDAFELEIQSLVDLGRIAPAGRA